MELKEIRNIVLNYYKGSGEPLLKQPKGDLIDKGKEVQTFLRDFVYFLIYTDFIPKEAKFYLTNENCTFNDVYKKFKNINKSTLRYRLSSAKQNINRIFGDRMLIEIMYYNSDLTMYERALAEVKEKYTDRAKFRNRYIIKLPELKDCTERVSIDRVISLIEDLKPYQKDVVESLQESIDIEALGYLDKLLSSNLTRSERDDKVKLKEYLKNLKTKN